MVYGRLVEDATSVLVGAPAEPAEYRGRPRVFNTSFKGLEANPATSEQGQCGEGREQLGPYGSYGMASG